MTNWHVEFEGPHGHSTEGPYYVGVFNITADEGVPKVVQVKLTESAEEIFAEEVTVGGSQFNSIVREAIIMKWGKEKIQELVDGGKELPQSLSLVTRPTPGHALLVTPVDAQLMLKRWGLID